MRAQAQADGLPHRRYQVSGDTALSRQLIAALGVALLLAHLLFAQLTLVLVVVFAVISTASRWRPHWLAAIGCGGLAWALAIGPARAGAGFAVGPIRVAGYFAGALGHPGRLGHLLGAFAGMPRWLPGQLPLAVILAAVEAAALTGLRRLRAGERFPAARPGLIVAVRDRATAAALRSGGVVTRTGARLGVDLMTGRPATISWREAESGVLCAGRDGLPEVAFHVVHAAIRRRMPVIMIDLTGSAGLARSVASACRASGVPLAQFGEDGQGFYEPWRQAGPDHAARLVVGMIDWGDADDQLRRACVRYLEDAFAVLAAGPGGPAVSVLDDLAELLRPGALAEGCIFLTCVILGRYLN